MQDMRQPFKWLVLPLLGILAACGDQGPKLSTAERAELEAIVEEIRSENPGITEACLKEMRAGTGPADPTPRDGCFKMQPARRWHGLWNRGWHWSNFCPAPAHECPASEDTGDVVLRFAEGVFETDVPNGVYELEFIGRRTRDTGHYGHDGLYDHEILVDRLISIRPVQVPWPAPDKETK